MLTAGVRDQTAVPPISGQLAVPPSESQPFRHTFQTSWDRGNKRLGKSSKNRGFIVTGDRFMSERLIIVEIIRWAKEHFLKVFLFNAVSK